MSATPQSPEQNAPQPVEAIDLIKEKVASKKKEKLYRNSLIYLIFLIPVVFIGDHLLGTGLEYLTLQSNFRYSRLYNGTAGAEVVILGNSRGHAFYEPEIERMSQASVFNLSYNALPISVGRALIEDYLERYDAKVLVIDVSMLTKTEENVITGFKAYQVFSPRLQKIIGDVSNKESIACQVSKLYNFNSEVFHRALFYLDKKDDEWILDKKISNTLIENTDNLEPVSFDLTPDRIRDLNAVIALAESKNVAVKLVIGPYFPEYAEKVHNLDEFVSNIEKATHHKVNNYSLLVSEDQMFSDYLHLNKQGSQIFLEAMHEDNVF